MVKKEIIRLLNKYVTLLNSEGISVKYAFLFGSYSTDSATNISAIDLMIVSDKYDETDDLIIGKMWQLTRKVNSKTEPILVGLKKFQNDDELSPLLSNIKSSGIRIK